MMDRTGWKYPKNDVHKVYEYIKSQDYFFIECPYGICWYKDNLLYNAVFYSYFFDHRYPECTFNAPYKDPVMYHCEEGCPDQEIDYEEHCREMRIEYKTVEYSYVTVYIYAGSHTHRDVQVESQSSRIVVPLCNSLRAASIRVHTVDEFKECMSFTIVEDFIQTKPINHSLVDGERQWLINKLYPIIEDVGEVDSRDKNLRLGGVTIPLYKRHVIGPTGLYRESDCKPDEFGISVRSIDWEQPMREEMASRRLYYNDDAPCDEEDDY